MPTKTRIDSLKKDLQKRYGTMLSAAQVGEVVQANSRSSADRWLRAEEAEGLRLLRFASRKGRFVLAEDLAAWLIRKS